LSCTDGVSGTRNLQDTGATAKYLIRDRDTKFTQAFDAVFTGEGIEIVTCAVRTPRMNSIMERWVQTCRRELLDRTLLWNAAHLLQALGEFEAFYNEHRPHRTLHGAAPLRARPQPITDPGRLHHLDVKRQDGLGGVLHEYTHAA
jgi:putative transposase